MLTLLFISGLAAAQVEWPALADGERAILMEFYEATRGLDWSENRGWGTDQSPCEWHGIICEQTFDGDESRSTVRVIDLSSNKLVGSIPESITRLRGLEGLDLSGNALKGAFPTRLLEDWDRANVELDIGGNAFSNLPVEARVDVRSPAVLCGPEANWTAVVTEGGRIRFESKECTPPAGSRKTHCVVRDGYAGSLARLARALDKLGYRDFKREYSDEVLLSTHSTFVTTTIRYGDGSATRVTTSGSHEPLETWMAQQLILSRVRGVDWDSETESPTCSMVR